MTEEEWLERCAARIIECLGSTTENARHIANVCLNDLVEGDLTFSPEEAADIEVEEWRE